MNRRTFLKSAAAATMLERATPAVANAETKQRLGPDHLPRWRGFNLQHKFGYGPNRPFDECEFEWIAGWGFDFVRLPMSYKCWTEEGDWLSVREDMLKEIDGAVAFGQKHKIHVCLNFHRAPGYCVGSPPEPLNLWQDEEALEACAFHWGLFAKRYQGIPNDRLSFNLVNEPPLMSGKTYVRVAKRLVEAIRAHDERRLIIADGIMGRGPVRDLIPLGVAQSTRGYDPMQITHYKASWVPTADTWAEPTAWPLTANGKVLWDKERLRQRVIKPWKDLESKGVGVHVGECGAHNRTRHRVVLAWLRDCLELWQEAGWGWALWNLTGSFGILDSGRADVEYEDLHGHKLDRRMLDLLQTH